MISKLLTVVAATILTQPAYIQSRATDSVKQIKAGEVARLSDSVTVKVTKSAKSPFTGTTIKGEAFVVLLELDAGNKGARLAYNLSADAELSNVYLASGSQRFAPRAVIEDFPSWGGDNDKEIEILKPEDKAVGASLRFQGKGSVSLLFDVPADQAKTQKKLSILIKTVEPTVEEHSFIVSI